jgi:Predicted chitinase
MTAPHTPATKIPLAVKMPFVTAEGKEFTDPEKLLDALGQQSGGYYLLGNNNCWHGGIHITDEKFAHHKNTHPVRCMMDGTVIAYRLNKNYPTQQWQAKSSSPSVDLKFSNGFCLIKHEYESPANLIDGENKGKTNKLTFYSLYMHLADYHTYRADNTSTEKKAFPGYWKSSIVGKSKERMKVYRTEHACKTRTTPHDALLNEQQTVTFDGDKVKWATIHGRKLKIALCKIDDAATFAHHSRLHEGWMIVDESQVSWKHAEPSEFDDIVKCHFPIKAGDPIGFMGIWESPFLAVGTDSTKTKYQMHVEFFTVDDKTALEKFLNNDAKLSSGKKYLRVPKGSKLYSSDGHGEFVNPHPLLNAARDYVFEESNCPQVKDKAGTVFYNIKGIRIGEMASGPIETAYVKLEDDVKLVTQYDWKDLGFTTLEENNTHSNGYIDPEKIPSPMFQSIFKRVDGIHNKGVGDGMLTGQEIQDTLQQDHALRNDLYKIIVCHPSEWHRTSQDNIKKLFEEIKAKNTEEEYKNAIQFEIDRFLKCEFASQIEGLTHQFWHFHPVLSLKSLDCCQNWINKEQLKLIAPSISSSNCDLYIGSINELPKKFKLEKIISRAHILAQMLHESASFRCKKESIKSTNIPDYYPYIGRGALQVTYYDNYKAYGDFIGDIFVGSECNMAKLENDPHYINSAGWFWCEFKNLTQYSNADDFIMCTAIVNGGFNGFDERLRFLNNSIRILGVEDEAIKNKKGKYVFSESEVFNKIKLAYGWGLWSDPHGNKIGKEKSLIDAKAGYQRFIELCDNGYVEHSPTLKKFYGKTFTQAKLFAEQRIKEL